MEKYRELITRDPADTEVAGRELARDILADPSLPRFVALDGDLGVGKTVFVRGFVGLLSPNSAVRSPTFTLVNEYRGGAVPVYHFDMYRISGEDDLYSVGYYDYLDGVGICLAEWCLNVPFALPEEYFSVVIEKISPDNVSARKISIFLERR